MSPIQQMLLGAGGAGADPLYVDDVFSIQTYTGNATTRTITSPHVDIATEGGFAYVKNRDNHECNWPINDTASGSTKSFRMNTEDDLETNLIKGFTPATHGSVPNGFTIGPTNDVNKNGDDYIGYMLRKAPGFIDVVKYTNAGSGNTKTINHSLGSVPGCIWIKADTDGQEWVVWHTSLGTSKFLNLNYPAAAGTNTMVSQVTSTTITLASDRPGTNAGGTAGAVDHVAYIFAHDSQVFGADSDQSIIKCSSYTGTGNNEITVNLGWEPQFVILKNTSESSSWVQLDSLRGIVSDGNDARLYINTQDEEVTNGNYIDLTPTGFTVPSGATDSGHVVVYIAIRASTGTIAHPPSAGTDVFAMDTGAGSGTIPNFDSGFPVDFAFDKKTNGTSNWDFGARLMNGRYMNGNLTGAEGTWAPNSFDSSAGWNHHSSLGSDTISFMWKRWKGCEVVTYTGNGNSGRSIAHSMNNVPEMMIVKRRSNSQGWMMYHKGLNGGTNPQNYYIELNETSGEQNYALWSNTAPTSTVFTVGNDVSVNNSNDTYIALLFSSANDISGNPISKVGSYTGNGSTTGTSVTTGFTVRFLIIKSTGDDSWIVIDTLREFTSTDSKYLQLPSTGGQEDITLVKQITNGFQLSSTFSGVNGSGNNYIYYAHA